MPPTSKPTSLKRAEVGGAKRDRGRRLINDNEPPAEPGEPDMPTYLDEAAQAEWNRLVPILLGMGVLKRSDGIALGSLCAAVSLRDKAYADLDKWGLYYTTTTESKDTNKSRAKKKPTITRVKVHPALAIIEAADARVYRWGREFGLTPSSRGRLEVDSFESGSTPTTEQALAEAFERRPRLQRVG